jgi:hypothetical protein
MGKSRKYIFTLAICVLLAVYGVGNAQDYSPEDVVRRIPLKDYVGLSPQQVWRLSSNGQNVDVFFTDSVRQVRRISTSVRLDGRQYRIAASIQTAGDLAVLVPSEQLDTLKKVSNMASGEKITVEGRTIGVVRADSAVLVDRILTGGEETSHLGHQLALFWRGGHQVINKPGSYDLEFPCQYMPDRSARFNVEVEALSRRELRNRLDAAATGKSESDERSIEFEKLGISGPDDYRSFPEMEVYHHIQNRQQLNVEFDATVKSVVQDFPSSVDIRQQVVRIGFAFETMMGLYCLVPYDVPEAVNAARMVLPGQKVEIKGVTLLPTRLLSPVLVTGLKLPTLKEAPTPPDVWLVGVDWPGEQRKVLYVPGRYTLRLPCQHAEGRHEVLRMELREVRIIVEGQDR